MKALWTAGIALLAFSLTNIPLNAKAQNSATTFRVLTLNFNAETANKILKEKRLDIIENYITQKNLDVMVIQECWDYKNYKSVAIKLAQDLNMDFYYHFEDGVAGIRATSLCMLTKKSLKLRNTRSFKLPHSAASIGDGVNSWVGIGAVNMLIGGTITLPNGKDGFFWTAHLNNDSSSNRLDQVKFAVTQMKALVAEDREDWDSAYTFFAGDFNSAPTSAEQTYLRDVAQFKDEWMTAHPGDPGNTSTGVITDPEYNPMVHGAGLFPSQYGPEDSERIDYVYARIPQNYATGVTRVFTTPVNGVWMSDHFGLDATFNFDGVGVLPLPSSDSDFLSVKPTTIFTLDDKTLNSLPRTRNFSVGAARGFTLVNIPNVNVQFFFNSGKDQVYTASSAGIGENSTVSFAFFTPGNYSYSMIVRDYRRGEDGFPDYSQPPITQEMDGVIQVDGY